MKTNTNIDQINLIIQVLAKLYVKPFGYESCDVKRNAQNNLRGRTHYVDDDTLRWHHSRICSAGHLHSGLLFHVTCSDALDMHNTKRGFRTVVFDVFGTTINRPKLEDAVSSTRAAINASEREEIDLLEHYRQAIAQRLQRQAQDAAATETALAMLGTPQAESEAA